MDKITESLKRPAVVLALFFLAEQVLAAALTAFEGTLVSPWNHLLATTVTSGLYFLRAWRMSYVAESEAKQAISSAAKANAPPGGAP